MPPVLVQSSTKVLPAVVAGQWHGSPSRSGRPRNSVKMISAPHAPLGLPMRSGLSSGLGGSHTLNDLVVKTSPIFHAKVASSVYFHRGKAKASRCVSKAMFERFNQGAMEVISLAEGESRRLGHNYVGTEQILLGLIGGGTGIPAKVLKSMGIELENARIEVEKITGRGSGFVDEEIIPFNPQAELALELSVKVARELGHEYYMGPEHLLLGLLREGEGVAARVLEDLGADPDYIRAQVLGIVGDQEYGLGLEAAVLSQVMKYLWESLSERHEESD